MHPKNIFLAMQYHIRLLCLLCSYLVVWNHTKKLIEKPSLVNSTSELGRKMVRSCNLPKSTENIFLCDMHMSQIRLRKFRKKKLPEGCLNQTLLFPGGGIQTYTRNNPSITRSYTISSCIPRIYPSRSLPSPSPVPLKDKSGVDKIIVKKQPYQLLNTIREFFPSFRGLNFHKFDY